jgi:hypothetical protein
MKSLIETDPCARHLPVAKSIPWGIPVTSDSTFESAEQQQTIYREQEGTDPNRSTIAYRRIPGMHQIIE